MAISELDLPIGVIAHSSADPQRQAELMADCVAGALAYAVQTHGVASLVVSGGRSPITFFDALSKRELNWAKVQISLADERWIPTGEPASNEGLVRRHLLQNAAREARLIGLYQPADSLARQHRWPSSPWSSCSSPSMCSFSAWATMATRPHCSQEIRTWHMRCGRTVRSVVCQCRPRRSLQLA